MTSPRDLIVDQFTKQAVPFSTAPGIQDEEALRLLVELAGAGPDDVALYAYTHVAGEGGFDLALYPAERAWLARVAAEPRHVPITQRSFG